ncbi:beta-ketoacyl-[acyl-carrier-protein] synthase family protein [Lactococcus muris]|uniref:beta-ketoacyl-[acyl-carrier-protein] synthase family protein n=1 Tax=Lactococcus muris TaxID=2941330 RepID=UPI002300B44E
MGNQVNITGVGVVSSLGKNLEEHKKNLFSQTEGIKQKRFINGEHELNSYVGAVESELEVPEKYQQETRNFKFAFLAFEEAISSANLQLEEEKDKKIAICLGTSLGGKVLGQELLYSFEDNRLDMSNDLFKKRSLHYIADELIAYHGIKASYYVISTACSASNNAVILGTQLLQDGKCDIAICGGCDELSDISLAGFTSLGAINKESPCQPYSTGSGISLGEGAGFIVLEKNKVGKYGKVLGGSITSDAYHITAPKATGEGAGQIALNLSEQSGVPLNKVDYINGHGTGTRANDGMEKSMIGKNFPLTVRVSSTKGQTGHTLGAAGIIETINCILAIEEKTVPATKTLDSYQEDCFVRNQNIPKDISYALNFSFAFGGNNSGVLLASKDTPEETFLASENIHMDIISHASTLESLEDKSSRYENISKSFSKIRGLRYTDFSPSPKINPAQYRRMDNFSKMIAGTVAKAIERSSLDFKKIDLNKVGILFTTPSGPLEVVEDIEKQIRVEGYHQVSASKFPFTVMNAAAGMLSILFKIKGPVSVISSNVGFADGIIYAEEMMKNEKLSHVLIVSASQWTDFSLFAWEKLGYDPEKFRPSDYCSTLIVGNSSEKREARILGAEQIKYDNKVRTNEEIKHDLISLIEAELPIRGITFDTLKGVVWNANKKTEEKEYDVLRDWLAALDIPVYSLDELDFSSDGAGEELDYVLNKEDLKTGHYLIISYSRFGGLSTVLLEKI